MITENHLLALGFEKLEKYKVIIHPYSEFTDRNLKLKLQPAYRYFNNYYTEIVVILSNDNKNNEVLALTRYVLDLAFDCEVLDGNKEELLELLVSGRDEEDGDKKVLEVTG